jgi:polar amino acid transport system substrate-binding protein
MRSTKITRLGATFAALALAATACGGGDGEQAGEFDTVTPGTLTMCSDIPYAPFEFEDPSTDTGYSGFDVELMGAIAEELGLELAVVNSGFDSLTSGASMAAGDCDLAASAMTITEEREENVDFSEPYYNAAQSLLVTADSDVTTLADLEDATIGVQSGTTGADYANDNAPDSAEIRSYDSGADLFVALEAGEVDAVLQDLPVNVERASQEDNLEVVETYETDENYGFAFPEEGSEDLLEAVNGALQSLRDDGTYDSLYTKYFEAEGE